MNEIRFGDIREDWYKANQLLPRIVRKALKNGIHVCFKQFPRQWIPIFEYYGLPWQDCRPPLEHMPIISEVSSAELARYCRTALKQGTLRNMVESVAALDPILADFLYILDHSMDCDSRLSPNLTADGLLPGTVRITTWQSYGRPEIRSLEKAIDQIQGHKSTAVVLPCSRRRPYSFSRTHKRIWIELAKKGIQQRNVHQVVVTSLAVLPEELWNHPLVMAYDAGVPDIYRTLRLCRRFFSWNHYRQVIDCLQFAPYSDLLEILERERIITNLTRGPVGRSRQFYVKHLIEYQGPDSSSKA